MKTYVNPVNSVVFAYDDEQIATGVVMDGLLPCAPRPSLAHTWLNGAWSIDAAVSVSMAIASNTSAIQIELDRAAKEKGYDNIVSACSYAAQPSGAPFQAEGAAFLAWRSAAWKHAYDVLDQVQSGAVPMPTPEEAVAQMPALILP